MTPAFDGTTLADLLDLAVQLDEQSPTEASPLPPAQAGTRPGDLFERDATWAQILEPAGWTALQELDGLTYWRRPGKVGPGHSATTGVRSETGRDLFICFTTAAAPLRARQAYNKFALYAFLHHGGNFTAASAALQATLARPAPPGDGLDRPYGYEMILAYFRRHYLPRHRVGMAVWSEAEGRLIKPGEATFGAPSALLKELATARDRPRDQKGEPNDAKLPQFFATWSRSAWADLLQSLPTEDETAEMAPGAQEQFWAWVASAFNSGYTFNWTEPAPDGKPDRLRSERRSVLEWGMAWAKSPQWRSVRLLQCWSRVTADGEKQVAFRLGLFEQLSVPLPDGMAYRKLVSLCQLYGVGIGIRAGGSRAVLLAPEFLRWLLARPDDVDGLTEPSRSRAGEENSRPSVNSPQPDVTDQEVTSENELTEGKCAPSIVNRSVNAGAGAGAYPPACVDGSLPNDGRNEASVNPSVNSEANGSSREDAWEGSG